MGITKHAAILCLVAAAPAAADDRAPRSLHMRETRWRPRLPGRVAQVQPDGVPGDPPGDAAPLDPPPDGAPPEDPSSTPPDAAAEATPPGAPPTAVPWSDAPAPASPASPDGGPTPPPAKATVTDDGETEVISVTDTAIERALFTGRAPTSVLTRTDLTASGRATLGDVLQSLPIQGNAANAQVNADGDGTTRINLRGLGAARTVVLVNGRRMVNGGPGTDASADLNSIPLAVIERVEIMKDGASAIYGADAIGGVVNLITRPEFDGTDVSLLTSTSARGDGTEYDASFVTGFTTPNKHTYLVLSAGYQRHAAVFAGDRGFSTFHNSYDFARNAATRSISLAAPSGRLAVSSLGSGGSPPPGCGADACKPNGDGSWSEFAARDLYNDAAGNYLYTPSSRLNVFASANNRLTDHSGVLVEVSYLRRASERELAPVAFVADGPISRDSLYNPLGGDILDYRRRITELGPRRYTDDNSTIRIVLGVTGNPPPSWGRFKDWKYELSHNYGVTKTVLETTGQLIKPRLLDAIGPSMVDNGVPICVRTPGDPRSRIIYTIPGLGAEPCVPLNLLAPSGRIPREQLEKLTYTDAGTGANSIHTLLATAGGQLAALPHDGSISLSLGADYRHEAGSQLPGRVASAGYTTDNAGVDSDGRFETVEGFGELAIVPLADHAIAQRVELDLGARVVRHSEFGASLTYKAGGLFRTVHGLAVRGTYATAFRAPSLPDIFGGRIERLPAAEDPCDTRPPSIGDGSKTLAPMVQAQCTAQGVPLDSKFSTGQQLSVIGGNPDLEAETAATATLGVVYEPPQIDGLALSADYWRVAIDNAIETLGVQTIFANCYDRGIPAFCDQIHRDPITHRISPVEQLLQNVDRTVTSGIDLAIRYDRKLATLGRIATGLEAQYLLRYDLDTPRQVIHGVGYYDLGVYPRYKANLSGTWLHPSGASGGLLLRFVGAYQECAANNCNNDQNLAEASRDVDRYFKLDLFGGYEVRSRAGKTSVQLGVNNVFDATPPVVYNAAAANSDAATYDFIGRLVYLRLSQQF